MFNRNKEIRKVIKFSGVPNWAIAESLGIHENSFYRLLRTELSDSKRKEILLIIKELQSALKEVN